MKRTLAVLLLGVAAAAHAAAPPELHLTVTPGGVSVSGATPTNDVVLMNVALDQFHHGMRQSNDVLAIVDSDGDGVVSYTPVGGIPLRSIWVAVDRDSGLYAIGGRPDYPVRALAFAPSSLKKDVTGEIASFLADGSERYVLIVRPKNSGGAWILSAFDGSTADADHKRDGKLDVVLSAATPVIGTAAAPKHLKNGDIVVAVDTVHMAVFAAEIGKGGAQ